MVAASGAGSARRYGRREGPSAEHPFFGDYDLVVIVTDHTALERERLLREAKLVVDTRDALRGISGDRSKVYGL